MYFSFLRFFLSYFTTVIIDMLTIINIKINTTVTNIMMVVT